MKSKKGSINVSAIVLIVMVAIGVIFAYNAYEKHNQRLAYEKHVQEESARQERERMEAERKVAAEKAEMERERQRQEKERAEAEREAERAVAAKRLADAAAERKRQIEEKEQWRSEYAQVRAKFEGCEAKVWEDVAPDARPMIADADMTCWCVFASYANDKTLYRAITKDGKTKIHSLSGMAMPAEVDAENFFNRCASEKNVLFANGVAWVRGLPKNGTCYAIPGKDFIASAAECGDFLDVITELGVTFRNKKYRLSLMSADGRTSLPLGIFEYDATIDREKLLDPISDVVSKAKQRSKVARGEVARPRLKRFKQTVVFCNGDMGKKDLSGVTHVPRTFKFRGTSHNKYYDSDTVEKARSQWEALRDEAERQEQQAAAVEAENQRILEAYERKKRQMVKDDCVTANDVEKELLKWRVKVDRSRWKAKAPNQQPSKSASSGK